MTASLRDPDGGVTGEAWQWARSQDGATNWEDIGTAASNAYTPVAADEDNYLRATVSYTDGDGPGKSANEISANAVEVVAVIENTAPEFPTSETGARSVRRMRRCGHEHRRPGGGRRSPGDTLTYTLGGTDAASFDIVAATGQLQTKVALDSRDQVHLHGDGNRHGHGRLERHHHGDHHGDWFNPGAIGRSL